MRFPFYSGKIDVVDLAASGLLGLAGLFVLTFFWQASAGAARSDQALVEELRAAARKRILREREQLRPFLDLETAAVGGEAWERAVQEAELFPDNSQFRLFLARGYGSRGLFQLSLGEYRRALEINRDYSDRRSEYYLGEELRPLLADARAVLLEGGLPRGGEGGTAVAVKDLFYIQRSLAGGCH